MIFEGTERKQRGMIGKASGGVVFEGRQQCVRGVETDDFSLG